MQIYYESVPWNEIADCEDTAALRTRLSGETDTPLTVERISAFEKIGDSFGYYSEVSEFADSIGFLDEEDEPFPQHEQFFRFMHTVFAESVESDVEISNDAGIYAVIAPDRLKDMARLFASLHLENLRVGYVAMSGDDGVLSSDEVTRYVAAMGKAVTECAERDRALIIFLN